MFLKKAFVLIVGSFWLIGCSQLRELVDTTNINTKIQYDISIQNPGELMQKFYTYSDNQNVVLDWEELREPKQYRITMIHSNIQNDTIESLKYVMLSKYNGDTWQVEKIKKSIKCQPHKGHRYWGACLCK